MVMYANEFKTKEKQKLTEIKKLTATRIPIMHTSICYLMIRKQ